MNGSVVKSINASHSQLHWTQPSFLIRDYELRLNDEIFSTLQFRTLSGSFATGENADGCWTFKRVGFFQAHVTIRECAAAGIEIAKFKNNTWTSGGTLTLANGRNILVTTNFWKTHLDIQTEAGEVLVHLHTKGFWKKSAEVSVTPKGLETPELSWLILFAWYVIVMMQMDEAALGAA